jgi:PleD family two-component response regulator
MVRVLPTFRKYTRCSVQSEETPDSTVYPEKTYHQAKVEHYLERADECIRMARFSAARRFIEKVLTLEPGNEVALGLSTNVHARMARLSAAPNGHNGNGNGSGAHGEIILLVDQDQRVLERLHEALHRNGYRVIGADGCLEAQEVLSTIHPDMIISEVNFESGPAGFDLYLLVSSNVKLADIPFLFLATTIDRDILIAGKRLGVDDFILKPVDVEVVVASIQHCLIRRHFETRNV